MGAHAVPRVLSHETISAHSCFARRGTVPPYRRGRAPPRCADLRANGQFGEYDNAARLYAGLWRIAEARILAKHVQARVSAISACG